MGDMADSMTNAIRSGRGSVCAEGTTLQQDAVVYIEWRWLILPLALVSLSAALLAATMVIDGRHSEPPLWKSSIWPLVFHGLDEWREEERRARRDGSLGEVNGMEGMARKISVTLRDGKLQRGG